MEGCIIKLLPHLITDKNLVDLFGVLGGGEALPVGKVEQLRHVVSIQRIDDVPEELLVRSTPCWVLVGQIHHDLGVLPELMEDVLDAELIILRDADEPDILKLEHLLLTTDHGTDEVLVAH